jgi:uncharacterized protein YcbK (DUF882 family)
LLLIGAGSVHDATALNETRTLSFHHTHSDEDLTVTFKRDGRYDEQALKQLNHLLRDWRTQDEIAMDRHLFDIIWEVYRDVGGKEPIQIISAYRSPATNAMLRHRSAHSGVARFSQHMLGHAMDFYIPNVSLEQIRYAGLRLQRGGVGFYPSSGSPFVHLDTGSIRHWPRMTHDQLAKVFPDGRTVHVPTDGVPLKGYDLAKADIEKRGDDAATITKPGFFAALFRSKSSDDEDEGSSAAETKPGSPAVAAASVKPADPVPTPRAKPQLVAAFQLASADAQLAAPQKLRQPTADPTDATPQTPADIINARGFWGDEASESKPATSTQVVASIFARKALEAADPQTTSSVPTPYRAMAYVPPRPSGGEGADVVTLPAPLPPSARPAQRDDAAATEVNTIVAKGPQDQGEPIANATRLSAGRNDGLWMRMMVLAPSASGSMSVTVLGDADLTLMRAYFIKPRAVIPIAFSDDPMMGLSSDHFSGSAMTKLEILSFAMRTALLN